MSAGYTCVLYRVEDNRQSYLVCQGTDSSGRLLLGVFLFSICDRRQPPFVMKKYLMDPWIFPVCFLECIAIITDGVNRYKSLRAEIC